MRYRFGPSIGRTTPALATPIGLPGVPPAAAQETLLNINLLSIASVNGLEQVKVQVAPPTAPPPYVRPLRIFAVYARVAPAPGVSPEEFLGTPGLYIGGAHVPDQGPSGEEPAFDVEVDAPPATEFVVLTVIEDPDPVAA